ncbi:MAG TPA: hypothetical protein DGT23_33590 [Micromonosporaceae bacterium]|nr:hypothetical protein [Micromonosporaceae bacterium]
MNWRLKPALVAGAALAFLPLSQGWWLDALWVLLGAAVVIGSWSLGAGVSSRWPAVKATPREVVVAQLVDHLRDRGWDLQSGRSSYYAFRDVGGFIHWTGHQVWLSTNPDPHPVPPEAVAVDVGN